MFALVGFVLIVALVSGTVGYALGQRQAGVPLREVEDLRREHRRIGMVLGEFVTENEDIQLNDPALVNKARGALQPFYRRELGE